MKRKEQEEEEEKRKAHLREQLTMMSPPSVSYLVAAHVLTDVIG